MSAFTPADLDGLSWPSDPRLSPDGTRAVWVATTIDASADTYRRSLQWWDGEDVRPFTSGSKDGSPRWSPDGSHVAFLRTGPGDDDRPQVAVMAANGGEARILTDLPLGASGGLTWAPDGAHLVVTASFPHARVAELSTKERARRAKRITSLPYRFDGEGWSHDRQTHLVLVDVDADPGDEVCLTQGDEFSESGPTFSPDGTRLAFTSSRHDDRETHPAAQVFTMPAEAGGAATPVTDDRGDWSSLVWDEQGLHAIGFLDTFDWPGTARLFRLGGDEPVPVDAGDRSLGDGNPPFASGLVPVADGLITSREDAGRTELVHVGRSGEVQVLLDGDRCVTGADATADRSVLLVTTTDTTSPGEVVLVRDGEETVLTACGDDLPSLRPTERFTTSRDGVDIDCWAVLPDGDGPWPVVLNIHGGPTSQYADAFFDEFQVQASAGYLVVGCNPRGSSGRGTDWARSVVGAWGEMDSLDMRDCLAVLDTALERYADHVDPDRLAVIGGSYGGYATARILTFDDRFRASIVERGLLQWESFSGTSDIGPYFDRMFLDANLAEDVASLRAASPVQFVDRISTPTLVLHSEEDYRCPMEQAEQLFVGLRRNGVETEFVRFPDEGHELSRSGTPKHRIERFDVVLEWLGRHLDNPWTTDSLAEFSDADEEG